MWLTSAQLLAIGTTMLTIYFTVTFVGFVQAIRSSPSGVISDASATKCFTL